MDSTQTQGDRKKTNHTQVLVDSNTQVTSMTGDVCINKPKDNVVVESGGTNDLLHSDNNLDSEDNTREEGRGSNQIQNNGPQNFTHGEKDGDKYFKTLELAMVELRPIPKPVEEAPKDQPIDCKNVEDIETLATLDTEKATGTTGEEDSPVSQNETNLVTTETNVSQHHSTVSPEILSLDQSHPVIAISCPPELSVSESLSPPNTDSGSQPAGTIASVTGDKTQPIDCPRIAEAVKLDKDEGINTATVTAFPAALLVSHNAHGTKAEKTNCQPIIPTSKPETVQYHNNNDRGHVPNEEKGRRPRGPNMSNLLFSHVDVGETKVKTYGHPAVQYTVQSRPSTRDRCRSSQRTLSRTGHSSGVNHYENSSKPAIANGKHKCFSPNSGCTQERSQSLPSYERPYGKRELRRALPRKSNFNCHDAAMKEAGFEDDSIAQRKAERLKERLARVASSMNPLLGLSSYVATGCGPPEIEVVVTDVNSNTEKHPETDVKNIETVAAGNLSGIPLTSDTDQSSQKVLNSGESTAFPTRDDSGPLQHLLGGAIGGLETTKRRRPGSAKIEYVECRPLSQYLEYIRDNRQEYINYIRHQQLQQQALRKDKAVARLIKMGQAFELRHQGGTTRARKSTMVISDSIDGHVTDDGDPGADVIVMAARALRPRTANPGKYTKTRDKSGGAARRGTDPTARPLSEDRKSFHTEKTSHAHGSNTASGAGGAAGHNAKEEEHPKTELEKRKLRAEDWTRSVPTHTLTRARIQSLRELGTDDTELTKWWEAFKDCHYLRQNICHT